MTSKKAPRAQRVLKKRKKTRKKKATKRPAKRTTSRKKKPRRLSKVELLQSQVQSLTRRLRKYEKQRFQGPLLPGQKRRKPPRVELDAIRTKLKLFFEGIKRNLAAQDIGATYRSHENENFSIDAELRVPLEDSGDVEGHFIDIEDAGSWNTLNQFWIMIGLNASGEEATGSPTIDRRPHRAWTNPVRGNRAGAAFFTARETVVKKLSEWGAEFSMIVIRIFWHPDNARPNRPRK